MTTIRQILFIATALLISHPNSAESAKDGVPAACLKWFKQAKVKQGKNCSMDCAMIDSDMSSFDCSRFCDQLCKPNDESAGFRISNLYPGLTEAEKKFVDKNPRIAVQAYLLSWRAEKLCNEIYLVSDTNDESDACRHYVWASLLNQKLGHAVAKEILDAHEQNPDEPEKEREMDTKNNNRALKTSDELKKSKSVSEKIIVEEFKKDIKNGTLIVLKKRSK